MCIYLRLSCGLDISKPVLLPSSVIARRYPYKLRMSSAFRVYNGRQSETVLSSLVGKYRFCPKINISFCITVIYTGNICLTKRKKPVDYRKICRYLKLYLCRCYIIHKDHKRLSFCIFSLPPKHYIYAMDCTS